MKNLKITFYTLGLGLFLMSCSSSEVVPVDPNPDPGNTVKTTYDKDVKTIINNSCATASCHDSTSPAAGLALTTFSEVKNAAQNGNLHIVIANNTMPKPPNSPLSSGQKSIIDKWKTDGYLEN